MEHRHGHRRAKTGGRRLVLAAALILAAPPIGAVRAQSAGPGQAGPVQASPEQIEQWLQEAAQIYDQLRPIAQQVGDRTLLQRMETLRTQWVTARGHLQGKRYQMAGLMARQNLDQMRGLSTQVRRLAQRLPFYSRLAERNREILQLMQQRLGPQAPPEMQQQLTLAADALQRARNARQEGNLLQAFRLMEQCESMLRQMLQQADRALDSEAVRAEIQETERRIEALVARGGLTEPAQEALERTRQLQSEARGLAAGNQLRQALARTLSARTALRLAQRLTGGALSPEDVAAAIDHAVELREMHAELARHTDAEVRALWQQSERQLEQARQHLEEGRLPAALEAAQSSAKLTLSAVRRTGAIPPLTSSGSV